MSTAPDHLLLQHGDARLVLDPKTGGAIREYASGGRAALRPSAPDAGADPFALASFPLVPYANRIAGGRFVTGGRTVQLPRNWDADPHPIHGQGWRLPWQVTQVAEAEATLELLAGGDAWPWRYRAVQHFRLERHALAMRLSIENHARDPMPAILGLHPYFPGPAHAQLAAHTPRVWMTGAGALPVQQVQTPPEWSFEPARPVASAAIDHCFTGWDGVAVLTWPDRILTMRARGCSCLHVYVPAAGDFFCVEPQTAATGALNREGEAALVQPGEQLAIDVSFTLEDRR